MNNQKLIYTEKDHKGQAQVIHAADCREGKAAKAYASGYGQGDNCNWDTYTAETREAFTNKLRGIYGDEEVDEYIIPDAKWEPCVTIK